MQEFTQQQNDIMPSPYLHTSSR